jgi:hypothetical protein
VAKYFSWDSAMTFLDNLFQHIFETSFQYWQAAKVILKSHATSQNKNLL